MNPAHCTIDRRAERSALARLETKLPRSDGASILAFDEKELPGVVGWWFPRRIGGVNTGLVRGVLSMRGECASPDHARAVRAFMNRCGSDLVRVTIVDAGGLGEASAEMRYDTPRNGLWRAKMGEEVGDALFLGDDPAAFLARLGSHTRRNIRRAEKIADELGVRFRFNLSMQYSPPDEAALALARSNVPVALTDREISAYESAIARQSRPFESRMELSSGELIHYCRGFIERDVAYVLYQANNIRINHVNQSLVHRFKVIRELIARDIAKLVFISGCGGLLFRACETLTSEEWIAIRPTLMGIVRAGALAIVFPRSWAGKAIRGLLWSAGARWANGGQSRLLREERS